MKLHITHGIYPNGSFKSNAVKEEDLKNHIQYNLDYRPGRALIVDGEVVYKGGVSEKILNDFKPPLWKPTEATVPYQ